MDRHETLDRWEMHLPSLIFRLRVNVIEAGHLARGLMNQHGLQDWSFGFDHARRRFGCCNYTHRRITLSRPLTFLNPLEEVRDTILHEIAHALTPGDHHGRHWRVICQQIGARPMRCYTDARVVSPPRKPAAYIMGCARCNWWVERRRTTRRKYQCKKCMGIVSIRGAGEPASVRDHQARPEIAQADGQGTTVR